MKLLIATGIYPPQIGGPATYAKLLYDELPRRGIDVDVVSFGDFLDKPKIIRHIMYFFEIMRRAPAADIIYALDPVSVGLPTLFASEIRGKRFFLRVAGDYAWEQSTQRFGVSDPLDDFARTNEGYPWQVRLLKKVQTFVAECAEKVVVPSGYLKSILGSWGIETEKVTVIYNGFRMDKIDATPSALKKSLKLSGTTIVTVARLVPWKGIRELIEIMSSIVERIPDAQLVVIGDGPEKDNLAAAAEKTGMAEKVIFTGRLAQKNVFEYIKASDLFVLNTSYEGFSHQIIETMALGTAVITTKVGGNPETIKNAETGILVPPGAPQALKEAILSLLTDPKRMEGLAKAAKKDVSRFTDLAMLEQITKLLLQK